MAGLPFKVTNPYNDATDVMAESSRTMAAQTKSQTTTTKEDVGFGDMLQAGADIAGGALAVKAEADYQRAIRESTERHKKYQQYIKEAKALRNAERLAIKGDETAKYKRMNAGIPSVSTGGDVGTDSYISVLREAWGLS